jgi:co-chaperonin GroES (HSP10)
MLRPLKSKVILELIEKDTVSAGGIVLAKADATEANRGKVVAVGAEVTDIEVGQEVLPNWNAAQKTKYEDGTFYIIEEEQIVLVFED